jgi:ribonuclease VapC
VIAIDASAVVAILRSKSAAARLTEKLPDADRCIISAANVLELQLALNDREAEGWQNVEELFRAQHITIREFDARQLQLAREAAIRFGMGRHKARLNFGDCFAYALARAEDVPLLCIG